MTLDINPAPPEVMHIDLNSAFAMTEQQANPLLRGKPVGITNRLNNFAICITASYEAKARGVSIGTRVGAARQLAPGFVILEADPAKYMYVHSKLRQIFTSYSPVSYMKSVDEGIIDFKGMAPILKGRPLEDVAAEIKQRVRDEVGDYMSVNIGIGQNRWLAKVGASLFKPDGLFTIDKDNLLLVYAMLGLTDLPYINYRYERRLHEAGIYTPLELYNTSERVLSKQVFKSINGHHWYLKLRGYETEVAFGMRTVGRSYVLEHRTDDPKEFATLLYKSCMKVARRLARFGLEARGLMLDLRFTHDPSQPHSRWFLRHMYKSGASRGDELYARALELYARCPRRVIKYLGITTYGLRPALQLTQPSLFNDEEAKRWRLEKAINEVNDQFGELALAPASVVSSRNPMKDKIPFGSIRYFD